MKLFETFTEEQKKMLESNMGLVKKYAWSYAKSAGAEYDDLEQEAYIGCLIAVSKFNPDKGKFADCAGYWIKKHIISYLDKDKPLYIKNSVKDEIKKVVAAKKKLEKDMDCQVTVERLAEVCKHNAKKIKEYLHYEMLRVHSYDTPIADDESKTMTLKDVLESKIGSGNPEQALEYKEFKEHFMKAFLLLEETEREIFILYYSFDKEDEQYTRTYKSVAELTGMTANTVSKRLEKTHAKIRGYMEENGYKMAPTMVA